MSLALFRPLSKLECRIFLLMLRLVLELFGTSTAGGLLVSRFCLLDFKGLLEVHVPNVFTSLRIELLRCHKVIVLVVSRHVVD